MYRVGLWQLLREDVRIHSGRKHFFITLMTNHSLRMLRWARIKTHAYRAGWPVIPLVADLVLLYLFSTQIGGDVRLGRRVKFPHPLGIVLGQSAEVGDDCVIFQNVTLGGHGRRQNKQRYPILKTGLTVYPNSVLIGGIVLEHDVTVGAGSVVNKSVEEGKTVVGAPARVVS